MSPEAPQDPTMQPSQQQHNKNHDQNCVDEIHLALMF